MQKRKWVLASLATSVVGLAIWALATPAIAGELFGRGAYEAAYSWPIFRFFGLPSLALVSAVVGYIFLRGFWLWGIALVCLHPVANIVLDLYQRSRGVFGPSGLETPEVMRLVFVRVVIFVVLALICTFSAAIGAALGLLIKRRSRGSEVTSESR